MRAGRPDRASGDALRRRVRYVLPADDAVEALLVHAGVARAGVVAVEDLGRDLDLGVLGHHLRRDLDAVHDLDAGLDDGVVPARAPTGETWRGDEVSSSTPSIKDAGRDFMSLMLMKLWIFVIPSQCSTSGIRAWKRVSCTPATL